MTERPRRPRAFRIDGSDVVIAEPGSDHAHPGARTVVRPAAEPQPDPAGAALAAVAEPTRRRLISWRGVLAAGVGGLVSLALGLAVDRLISEAWARAEWLGWVGVACLALALLALLAIVVREVGGLRRLARVEHLRLAVAAAHLSDDRRAAPPLIADLAALYADRPDLARARAALAGHAAEVIDGRDLLALAERELMSPLDAAARILVLEAGKRVSVVTAISPRAIVDIAYVAWENLRLMRRLAELYGGRPGTLGFLSLVGRIFTHLGVTGGMALGDTLVQQLVGQGLAARLSARLGEGVVNGLLTARLGLAALDLVRPMPWTALPRPSLGDMMGELTRPTAPLGPRPDAAPPT
ncbi:TIGR01620 family protein [Siculibacillus lacustris]|uniref:TIGR01620 family protein n=1 Tax=Siculibacillus lacustris TaxID=1549641 RepID=A0A4V2KSM9_9HYPH|nr:TIGR01620 family protein [Siculibacillus lacustris]TBW33513.1 TIGR01620 family protein [Siculibacillus lacustris]